MECLRLSAPLPSGAFLGEGRLAPRAILVDGLAAARDLDLVSSPPGRPGVERPVGRCGRRCGRWRPSAKGCGHETPLRICSDEQGPDELRGLRGHLESGDFGVTCRVHLRAMR